MKANVENHRTKASAACRRSGGLECWASFLATTLEVRHAHDFVFDRIGPGFIGLANKHPQTIDHDRCVGSEAVNFAEASRDTKFDHQILIFPDELEHAKFGRPSLLVTNEEGAWTEPKVASIARLIAQFSVEPRLAQEKDVAKRKIAVGISIQRSFLTCEIDCFTPRPVQVAGRSDF